MPGKCKGGKTTLHQFLPNLEEGPLPLRGRLTAAGVVPGTAAVQTSASIPLHPCTALC